ncbi:unnamed protein product [Paramecium sonneborni]|uniref:non-specific serine/threonine protein kinase n=1 Tax=Paramecium sonneborni TaxID=65129 RepID=A0A8S1N8V1_9CILI|nr:unnamed protein product [Paramecium sonneborni]
MILKSAKENETLPTKTLSNITRLLKSKIPLNNQNPQTSLLDDYKLEAQIGQGQFAQVRICRSKENGQRFAMKIYQKCKLDQKTLNGIHREISILKQLEHQNIVKLHNSLEDEKCIYLLLNYASSVSLAEFTKDRQLSDQQIKIIFKQLMMAVQYLHTKSISHRDIKLENILYSQQIVLIDFGFAIQTDKLCSVQCGTPNYMAPELLIKQPYNPFASDIWACGIVLHLLLVGEFPKNNKISNSISGPLQKIVLSCLDKNAERRWTADKVLNELNQISYQ